MGDLPRRHTEPVIAMCQNPEGIHEHIPLKPGEKVGPCFADCDCAPSIYVALDAVVEALTERDDDGVAQEAFDLGAAA